LGRGSDYLSNPQSNPIQNRNSKPLKTQNKGQVMKQTKSSQTNLERTFRWKRKNKRTTKQNIQNELQTSPPTQARQQQVIMRLELVAWMTELL